MYPAIYLFLHDGDQPLDAAHPVGLGHGVQALQKRASHVAAQFNITRFSHE